MPTSRRRPFVRFALGAAVVAVALVGCATPSAQEPDPSPSVSEAPSATPTPTPEPRAPTVDELVITPDGLGTLVIGQEPSDAPELRMIQFEPNWCADSHTGQDWGVADGDPNAARWVPIAAYGPDGAAPWGVSVLDGVLERIDIFDESIPTDLGIRIGDSREAALDAYSEFPVSDQEITQVIVVPGDHGVLHVEIASGSGDWGSYWGDLADTVVYLRAVTLDFGVFTVAASENIAGGCL